LIQRNAAPHSGARLPRAEPIEFDARPFRGSLDIRPAAGGLRIHLADLGSYLEADCRLRSVCAGADTRAGMAIRNIAGSGTFSSDRTIAAYAGEI
jgi:Carbohydrate phosphorylase